MTPVNQPAPEVQETPPTPHPSYKPTVGSGKRKTPVWLWVVIALLVLALLGGAYWFSQRSKTSKPAAKSNSTTQKNPTPAKSTSTNTKHYISNGKELNLEFDYPDDWTVTPESGNNATDQPIAVISPLVSVTNADGATVTGKVIVSIRPSSEGTKELGASNPTTVAQDSVQIAYKAPTSAQHQYPFLTFIHFANASKASGAFEEVMITGVQGFKKGDPITSAATDPIISASFYQCSTEACTGSGGKFLSITYTIWQNTPLFKQVQDLFASLKIN